MSKKSERTVLGVIMAILNGVGSLLILAMVALICADIIGRELFNTPVAGVAELISLSIVAVVFFQLGHAVRSHSMARTGMFLDILYRRRPRLEALFQCVYSLIAAFVFAVLIYGIQYKLRDAWMSDEHVGVYGLFVAPVWPVYVAVLIGSTAATVQFSIHTWRYASRALHGGESHDSGVS